MYFPVNMTFFQIYHPIFWPYWKDLKGLMKDTRADHPPDIDEKLAAVNLAPDMSCSVARRMHGTA